MLAGEIISDAARAAADDLLRGQTPATRAAGMSTANRLRPPTEPRRPRSTA